MVEIQIERVANGYTIEHNPDFYIAVTQDEVSKVVKQIIRGAFETENVKDMGEMVPAETSDEEA